MEKRIAVFLCYLLSLSAVLPASSSFIKGAPPWVYSAQTPSSSEGVEFAFGGDAAEIPADFTGNIPFLPLRVGSSRPLFFLLDSTAPSFSIDPDRAHALGMQPMQRVVLNLNGVSVPVASLPMISRNDFSARVGRACEGTLGKDFFEHLVVEIDYGRRAVRLYDPTNFHYSGGGTTLPLTFSSGVPIVRARFTEPRGKVFEAAFAVNTALDASVVISDRYAESHHLFKSHWKTIPSLDPELDESHGVVLGRLKGFQLGRNEAQDAIATFSRASFPGDSDTQLAGEIGGGLLARYKVIFDYPHQQLIVESNLHLSEEEQEDKSGISVVAKGPTLKTFQIVQVQPKTPAAQAGLQAGDVISGIDTDAAADLTLYEIRDLFRQIGHKYSLVVDRNGEAKQVVIQMRRLLN